MDQQKLRTLVFEKTGVRIDVDDPVFALVALNEAVLAEAVERHIALLHQASDHLTARVAAAGGAAPPAQSAPVTAGAAALAGGTARTVGIACGGAVLSALLVLAGQTLLPKPAPVPVPAPTVQARAITPREIAAISNAAKLVRIIDRLDPETRSVIEAEMQKP